MEIITTLNLNDYLSTKSNWHRRFLYDENYSVKRDVSFVNEEYDKERYAPLQSYLLQNPKSTVEDLKQLEFKLLGMDQEYSHIYSIGEVIYRSPLYIFRAMYYEVIKKILKKYITGRLCELGCGYGYNLDLLKYISKGNLPPYGGELSDSCISIAKQLEISVSKFNFLIATDYKFIMEGSTIFTHHAVEQLPTANVFLDNLSLHKEKINEIILLEPTYIEDRSTLLGGMRNKFNLAVDHNHDLLKLIHNRKDIDIINIETDFIGMHPLNSTNLIVFKFK